jgi:SAM-dependent methyltransferase
MDRFIRKVFPSASRLTYNSFFKLAVDGWDLLPKALVPWFRRLPPNHLRIRVGVGNDLLSNQDKYFRSVHFWMYALQRHWIDFDSVIIDLGVGCGRYAHHLRDFHFHDARFSGHYYGVDIDAEALRWCRKNFDSERFSFLLSSDPSVSYNQPQTAPTPYHVPLPDGQASFVFSTSLFSHLLEQELRNYISESYRLLSDGGVAAHGVFCLDHPPPTYGKRHTFSHSIGNARVESMRQPEAAVAYTKDYLFRIYEEIGFRNTSLIVGPSSAQPILVGHK